jgi:hypothetical protein
MTLSDIKFKGIIFSLLIMAFLGAVAIASLRSGAYFLCALIDIFVFMFAWDAWKFATLKCIFIPKEDIDKAIAEALEND